MGVRNGPGDGLPASPADAQSELVNKAMAMGLGFSRPQLLSAIRHYFQVFESVEEACAWIPRENFSIVVDYILENPGSVENHLPSVDYQSSGKGMLCTHFSSRDSEKLLGEKNKGGLSVMHMNKKHPDGTLNANIRSSKVKTEAHEDRSWKNAESSERKVLPAEKKAHPAENKALWLVNGCRTNNIKEEVSEDSLRMSNRFGRSANSLSSGNGITKQSVVVTDKTSKEFGRWDKKALHSHYRQKMVPEVSADRLRATLDGLKNPQNQPDKCVVNTNVEGESSSSALLYHFNTKMKGCSSSGVLDTALPPLQIGAVQNQKFHDKTLEQGSCKSAPKESLSSLNEDCRPSSYEHMEHGNSSCIPQDSLEQCSCSCVGQDKGSSSRAGQDKGSSSQVGQVNCPSEPCIESLELRALMENGEEDNASLDKPDGVVTASYIIDLECCLRKGECEKALNLFEGWKKKGFKVEREQANKHDFVLSGGGHELLLNIPGKKRGFLVSYDISRGLEKLPISCVNEYNTNILPEDFLYITVSVIRQAAHVDTSLSRIGDLHCSCSGDCLRSPGPGVCKCTDSTRGEYAYDQNGRLIERLATNYPSGWGTHKGDFITECSTKCCCLLSCGNRVVQRGITKKLQVFMTPSKKGWGVRALEKIPARSFVFEYVGEVATNLEQFERNKEYEKNGVYTYTMNLDADLDMEKKHFGDGLTDTELLVLDATKFGNVSRFVNHRCHDPNLLMRPVQIETRDTHYYHAALFAARDIEEMEELTWDYGIDFADDTHQVKAFTCRCKSQFCRDTSKKRKALKLIGSKNNKVTTMVSRLKTEG